MVGKALRSLLPLDREYTIRGLAAKAGVNPATIVRVEGGQRASKLTLAKLAKALDVPLVDLLELAEDSPKIAAAV